MKNNIWSVVASFEDGCENGHEYLGAFIGSIKDIALSIDVNRYVRNGCIEDMQLHFYDISNPQIYGERKCDKVVVYQINGEMSEKYGNFIKEVKEDITISFDKKTRVLSTESIDKKLDNVLKSLTDEQRNVLNNAVELGLDINEILSKKGK